MISIPINNILGGVLASHMATSGLAPKISQLQSRYFAYVDGTKGSAGQ